MSQKLDLQKNLDKEFVDFLTYCKKQKLTVNEIKLICEPLKKYALQKFLKHLIILILICILIILGYNYINSFSWSISALGRIILIKLLPFWDWTELHNAKCLISSSTSSQIRGKIGRTTMLGKYETESNNCGLCEHFDRIDVISNTSFYDIQQNYLEKGLPVLINDSHLSQNFKTFAKILKHTENFIDSDPCDVETNFLLNRFINIEELLEKCFEDDNENVPLLPWFFHLRNCHFSAIKASRKFINRPYFYSAHLEPFYSSWILMSKNFRGSSKELYVDGIIIVQQITGQMIITLTAKKPCEKICGEHSFILNEGESLVFSTDLWIFAYTLDDFGESAATITETRW